MHCIQPAEKFKLACLSLFFLSVFISCGTHKPKKPSPSGFSDKRFTEKLQTILLPVDTVNKKKVRTIAEDVRYTYQSDDYQPIWLKENFLSNESAGKLIAELEDMQWDGINPERYNVSALKKLKEKLDTTKKNSVNDAIAFDTAMTRSYIAAARDLLMGEIMPKTVDSLWFHVNDTTWNAPQQLVNAKGVYPSLNDFRSQVPTYALLRDEYKRYTDLVNDTVFNQAIEELGTEHDDVAHPGTEMLEHVNTIIRTELPWLQTVENDSMSEEKQLVITYQKYNGLQRTGKLDSNTLAHLVISPATLSKKISANMERLRWMQKQFGDLYLVVDVPLMELFLRKDGINVMHMRVVVGKPERQTPSLFATMANVVINPPWGVPPTILKNDVLPGVQKDGKKYLNKKGIKVYDNKGKMVKASSINAGNYKRFNYKQDPGDDNALGYVKFNLPNPWDIYLHDTPHRADFDKNYRALSSGCIRLQQPQEMAVYILSEIEKRKFTSETLDNIIETEKTRWEVLKTKIPVHIAYLTAFEDSTGKHLQFARDIYHRDDKLILLLN